MFYFTLYAVQFNLCFIYLVLGYLCMNIFKMFLEYFKCFKSTFVHEYLYVF
jgi:hypothetical protein